MKKILKSMKWLMLFSGIAVVILGITMLFTPLKSIMGLAVFIGIAMTISGISEILSYLGEEREYRSGWILASGIISALLGGWTIFGSGSEALAVIIPYIFAVWVIAGSILRIVGSLSLKREGCSQWAWVLALGVIGALLGTVLLFSPALSGLVSIYTIAMMLIVYGINNIILFFRMKKIGDCIRKRLEA